MGGGRLANISIPFLAAVLATKIIKASLSHDFEWTFLMHHSNHIVQCHLAPHLTIEVPAVPPSFHVQTSFLSLLFNHTSTQANQRCNQTHAHTYTSDSIIYFALTGTIIFLSTTIKSCTKELPTQWWNIKF